MTSWHGRAFCISEPLGRQPTGHRWILLTRTNDAEIWLLLLSTWTNCRANSRVMPWRLCDVTVIPLWQIFTDTLICFDIWIPKSNIFTLILYMCFLSLVCWFHVPKTHCISVNHVSLADVVLMKIFPFWKPSIVVSCWFVYMRYFLYSSGEYGVSERIVDQQQTALQAACSEPMDAWARLQGSGWGSGPKSA